jgi:hypothetical protein
MPSGMHSPASKDTLWPSTERRNRKKTYTMLGGNCVFQHDDMADRAMSISNRSFLTRAYPTMKHHNPHTPIMVREALNTQPRVFARYEFGREKVEELGGESLIFLSCLSEIGPDVGEEWWRGFWVVDVRFGAKRVWEMWEEGNESICDTREREEDICLLTVLQRTGLDDKAIEDKIATLVREGAN